MVQVFGSLIRGGVVILPIYRPLGIKSQLSTLDRESRYKVSYGGSLVMLNRIKSLVVVLVLLIGRIVVPVPAVPHPKERLSGRILIFLGCPLFDARQDII